MIEKALALIEKTAGEGFDSNAKAIGLVKAAIESLTGSMEEKLAAIESAVKSQTTELSAKLVIVEAAIESGFADNKKALELVKDAIGSLEGTVETKLESIRKAIARQTKKLGQKMALIEAAVTEGFIKNAEAIDLVKDAVDALEGTVEEKLAAINETIGSQTNTLSEKLAAIEGSIQSGLVGEDSTLGLVKKAIDALNATAGTANNKLDAIKNAIDSPTSGLNVKLEAIEEALSQGLIDVTKKQDLILAAINSASTYHFTKDELLEVGDDYLYVDDAFWVANHENYEVVRALKDLIPLSLPHRYKFWWRQDSGKYPLSGSETTSFYGPLYTEGGILNSIIDWDGVILAVYIGQNYVNPDPVHTNINGHSCYYIKKVHKNCSYRFWVKIGERAAGKNLKVQDMIGADSFRKIRRPDGDYIEYIHKSTAIKSTSGVWGFRGLYYPNQYPDNSVEFIIVEDN